MDLKMVTKLAQMRSRDLLGPFWDHLGASRGLSGPLGVSWDHLGTILEPLETTGAYLAILGPSSPPIGLGGMREALEFVMNI